MTGTEAGPAAGAEPAEVSPTAPAPVSTFASLRVPTFRLIWIGGFLYFLAIFAQMVARGWLALELSGTNAGLGAVTMAFGVASLVTTPLGGVMADRFPKRRILIFSTSLLALSGAFLAVAILTGAVQFWMLLVASAVEAVAFSLLVPARMALTVRLVGPALLLNAVVLSQISMNANRIIGPGLAGALMAVSWSGPGGVYLVGAVACGVAVVIFVLVPRSADHTEARPGRRAPLGELVDGVRYAAARPVLADLLVTSLVVTMFGFSYITFLPTVADDFFGVGDSGFAVLSASSAVGGLVASLLLAGRVDREKGWAVQTLSGIGFGLGVVGLAVAPSYAVALGVSVALGACVAAFQSMNATLVLANAEPEYHGRMQSLLQLGFSAFGLAGLPLGLLADAVGLRRTLAMMGVVAAGMVLASNLRRRRAATARLGPAA